MASKMRLGEAPIPLPSDCPSCHTRDACALDPLHPLVCIGHKGRDITLRHHDVVDRLAVSTVHAGGLALKEPTHLGGKEDNTRPDLELLLQNRKTLVDVTVVHPGCKTNIMHGSARQQLAAAHQAEKRKQTKYAAMAKTQQASFVAFAVETYGGMGKQGRKLIKKIASVAQDRQQMVSEKEVRQRGEASVAIAVQTGNARIMQAAYYRATKAAAQGGRGFTASAA
jgi:hypothetical protein